MRRFLQEFILTVVMLPVLLNAQAAHPDKTCEVRGRIADLMDAAINRAFVLVHSDAWVKITEQVKLTETGEFRLQLKPGIYAFFADSPGFVPIAKTIDRRSCRTINLKHQDAYRFRAYGRLASCAYR